MRKLGLFLVVTVLAMGLVLISGGTALANYGPHGGYGSWADTNTDGTMQASEVNPDSDACAGCHRAHTAVSSASWEDKQGGRTNSLLIGGNSATTLMEFCYSCHSDLGMGAGTNVQGGVYELAKVPNKVGFTTTQSENGAVLNGGGIDAMGGNTSVPMTSIHTVNGATGIAWGEGTTGHSPTSGGTNMIMDCASCHDPHGSSNYRILKDEVNGVKVGGYVPDGIDPQPTPFVISNEVGYPTGGFRMHRNYGALGYAPDYTEARYAQPVGLDTAKGISGWCSSCHTQYNTVSSSGQGAYLAGDGYPDVVRHRHPVNVPLDGYNGYRALLVGTTAGAGGTGLNDPWNLTPATATGVVDIPLEHDVYTEGRGTAQTSSLDDFIGCLTCHRAHGTTATMNGYANSSSASNPIPDSGGVTPTSKGVPPTSDSALLRANNRGVCERCHNK